MLRMNASSLVADFGFLPLTVVAGPFFLFSLSISKTSSFSANKQKIKVTLFHFTWHYRFVLSNCLKLFLKTEILCQTPIHIEVYQFRTQQGIIDVLHLPLAICYTCITISLFTVGHHLVASVAEAFLVLLDTVQ